MKNIALILLGGKGKRMGNDIPKQFLKKNDIPIYIYAIKNYEDISAINDIVLVVHHDYIDNVKEDIKKYHIEKVRDIIHGGSERFISSYLGVKRCYELFGENNNVLIADAVRPNTSRTIILANIFALIDAKAVLTAIKGDEEEKRIDTGHVRGYTHFLAQTPQSFNLGYIFNLYEKYINEDDFFVTDEISIVEKEGDDYVIVEGEENNYKITNPNDLERFLRS